MQQDKSINDIEVLQLINTQHKYLPQHNAHQNATKRIILKNNQNIVNLENLEKYKSALQELIVMNSPISDISILQEVTNSLNYLELQYTTLKNFYPIQCLYQLRYLNLSNNLITELDIDFKQLQLLVYLNLSNNRLNSINISQLQKLQYLNVKNNQFSNFKNLKLPYGLIHLNIDLNYFSDLQEFIIIQDFKQLQFLYVRDNPVTMNQHQFLHKMSRLQLNKYIKIFIDKNNSQAPEQQVCNKDILQSSLNADDFEWFNYCTSFNTQMLRKFNLLQSYYKNKQQKETQQNNQIFEEFLLNISKSKEDDMKKIVTQPQLFDLFKQQFNQHQNYQLINSQQLKEFLEQNQKTQSSINANSENIDKVHQLLLNDTQLTPQQKQNINQLDINSMCLSKTQIQQNTTQLHTKLQQKIDNNVLQEQIKKLMDENNQLKLIINKSNNTAQSNENINSQLLQQMKLYEFQIFDLQQQLQQNNKQKKHQSQVSQQSMVDSTAQEIQKENIHNMQLLKLQTSINNKEAENLKMQNTIHQLNQQITQLKKNQYDQEQLHKQQKQLLNQLNSQISEKNSNVIQQKLTQKEVYKEQYQKQQQILRNKEINANIIPKKPTMLFKQIQTEKQVNTDRYVQCEYQKDYYQQLQSTPQLQTFDKQIQCQQPKQDQEIKVVEKIIYKEAQKPIMIDAKCQTEHNLQKETIQIVDTIEQNKVLSSQMTQQPITQDHPQKQEAKRKKKKQHEPNQSESSRALSPPAYVFSEDDVIHVQQVSNKSSIAPFVEEIKSKEQNLQSNLQDQVLSKSLEQTSNNQKTDEIPQESCEFNLEAAIMKEMGLSQVKNQTPENKNTQKKKKKRKAFNDEDDD